MDMITDNDSYGALIFINTSTWSDLNHALTVIWDAFERTDSGCGLIRTTSLLLTVTDCHLYIKTIRFEQLAWFRTF